MGTADRGLRILVALIVALLFLFDVLQGTLGYVLLTFAIVFVVTSLLGFCPLYSIFGLRTCKKNH